MNSILLIILTFLISTNFAFADTCPDQSIVSEMFVVKANTFIKCKSGKIFKIGKKDFEEINEKIWLKNAPKNQGSPGLDGQLKVCSFYTDEMMIDCPQGMYIKSDLINEPALEQFINLKVHLENLQEFNESKLKKMKYLDRKLEHCTYYNDKMMIDCPQGLYVRNDLVKNPKVVQFLEQKKQNKIEVEVNAITPSTKND